ncbi:hypothetical protein X975_22408, partial [Stegodyphus mimosarum]
MYLRKIILTCQNGFAFMRKCYFSILNIFFAGCI